MYRRTLESAVVSTDRCDLLCLDLPRAEQLRHALNLELTTQAAARARALGDPTRMLVAAALRDGGELCVCDLSWIVARSQGLVSHHLRALRAQELVRSRRGRQDGPLRADRRRTGAARRPPRPHRRGGMSSFELPTVGQVSATPSEPGQRSEAWLRAARHAKLLAWASLGWMSVEGFVGVLAGVQAHSLGVVTWAASSFVEALASLIVVWRFTGRRRLSQTSEARAQKWIAASFFLLAPYFVIEAIRKLVNGGDTKVTVLAVALTSSAIVLMPLLGWAKLRLGKTLDSGATAGEGIQNIMCAVQAVTALVAVAGAGIGLTFLDPAAALVIAALALKEGRDGWRGHDTCCAPMPGLNGPVADCRDDCCA